MKARNVLQRAANILTTAILVVAVCFAMVAVSATLALGKGEASLLGWKPYIVLSDSMREDFQVGDLAFSHEVDPATLGPGDIVTFASIDPASYGDVVTHKIRKIVEHEGEPAFVTYGTTTGGRCLFRALQPRDRQLCLQHSQSGLPVRVLQDAGRVRGPGAGALRHSHRVAGAYVRKALARRPRPAGARS